jgi:predicted XRE-type DNA-binding protein
MVKRKKSKPEKIEYEVSSGNVYEDFGFQKPEEEDAKSDLALLIRSRIKAKKLTQKQAAELMEIDQPKVSKIMRGLLSEFTIDRLMKYLVSLGYEIEIKPRLTKTPFPSIYVSMKSNLKRLSA